MYLSRIILLIGSWQPITDSDRIGLNLPIPSRRWQMIFSSGRKTGKRTGMVWALPEETRMIIRNWQAGAAKPFPNQREE
ncbi:hypothetical protein BUE76_07750 [Cnuella takakiae]|nr:hypothetical protein BUE76_07750 [Cnuella takakiae]